MAAVLLVDDEPDIVLMLRVNLETEGHDVRSAGDGAAALARIAERPPDVVLLDVMMPVLDGWAVLERLADQPSPPPVIVVSAKSNPRDARRALELGAVAYVVKPFDLEAVLELVAEVAAESETERAARRQGALGQLGSTAE